MKIKEEWKWAAKDNNGKWYIYKGKPSLGEGGWSHSHFLPSPFIHEDLPWDESLCILKDNEYVPYVDVPEDGEPVIVTLGGVDNKRYSTGTLDEDGRLLCYADGATKWTSRTLRAWPKWRRPTEEELK